MTTQTVRALAERLGGKLLAGDPTSLISGFGPTDRAGPGELSFLTEARYLPALKQSKASAVLLTETVFTQHHADLPKHMAVIAVEHPYLSFAYCAQLFAPPIPHPQGIHPSAVVEAGADIAADVALGAFVFVGKGARLGKGAILHAGAHVATNSSVGEYSVLYDHVVIRHVCSIGARCILHAGVVVGADGFGFAQDTSHALGSGKRHVKIPQVGGVEIEDDVEVGANSCVDRGTFQNTRIGRGTKIDNLVQIAHNVHIGADSLLIAQSGIAGSTRIGRGTTIAAQAGIAGHVNIGDAVTVLGQSGVREDIPDNQTVGGSPAVDAQLWFKNSVRMAKLDSLFRRVKKLEGLLHRRSPDGDS